MIGRKLLWILAIALPVVSCATEPAPPAPPSASPATSTEGLRQQILARARAYVEHRWSGGPANSFHGDWQGYALDTPDRSTRPDTGWSVEGEENLGVSYKWGGFSSLEQFDQGISDGLWAGHLPLRGGAPPTRKAVGVDCSGLVSRVWGLPNKQSTTSLPRVCVALGSYDDLLPGDILNRAGHHTMLFVAWVDEEHRQLEVIEATARQGRVHQSLHPRAELERQGYLPLRYRALDRPRR